MNKTLPPDWQAALQSEMEKPYFAALESFVTEERAHHEIFPPNDAVFNALRLTPLDSVRVFILGQDPYHDTGQAHGLAFSVLPGIKPPPSLANIFRELKDDVAIPVPQSGTLTPWAEQGVLLLNAVLTVRAHQPNSHKNKGWETFTDAVIKAVAEKPEPVVFVLWGAYAQKKQPLIEAAEAGNKRHTIIASVHPSPLSARGGFFGSRPFSRVNAALTAAGKPAVDWGALTPPPAPPRNGEGSSKTSKLPLLPTKIGTETPVSSTGLPSPFRGGAGGGVTTASPEFCPSPHSALPNPKATPSAHRRQAYLPHCLCRLGRHHLSCRP